MNKNSHKILNELTKTMKCTKEEIMSIFEYCIFRQLNEQEPSSQHTSKRTTRLNDIEKSLKGKVHPELEQIYKLYVQEFPKNVFANLPGENIC